jgi:hypothetical protein
VPGAAGNGWRVGAVAFFAVITLLTAAGPLLTLLAGESLWPNSVGTVALYAFPVAGVLIAVRRPRNAVAWVCLTTGGLWALESALWGAAFYGFANPGTVSRPELLAAVGDAFVMPGLFLPTTLLLLLFPDGRLLSTRWRIVAWLTVPTLAIVYVAWLVAPNTSGWGRPEVDNPLASDALAGLDIVILLVFVLVLAAVAALVMRFRRAAGIERLQLKWLVAAGVGATTIWLGAVFVVEPLLGGDAAVATTVWSFALIPTAIGVAVLRYRLFDIDRLISRTVTYALLVGVLVAVYAGVVFGVQALVPASGPLAVAGSTLLVAALFHPLRRRLQATIDRRFHRSRYDAARELERFALRLRDEFDVGELNDDLLSVVTTTVQPAAASVWISDRSR